MLLQIQENIILIIAGTGMFLLLGMFIISFLFFYQRKRITHITERDQMKAAYSQEILTTQIEVQDQTLKYISQELHDNIGQVLSFIKLNLGTTPTLDEEKKQRKIDESRDLLAQVITDLRDLSKSLSFQQIKQYGLFKAMQLEVDRVNKSGLMKTTITVNGDPYPLGEQRELVLFRIFQESMNNALKYAHAINFNISLKYAADVFNLTMSDNGVGFDVNIAGGKSGSGLKNIEHRASLIRAKASLRAAPGEGCTIKIDLDPIKQINSDGTYPNSAG